MKPRMRIALVILGATIVSGPASVRSEASDERSAPADAPPARWPAWEEFATNRGALLGPGAEGAFRRHPAQREQINATLEETAQDRARFAEASQALNQAREDGDTKRARELSEKARETRERFRPSKRIDRMGAVLTEEQRERFERNRRLRGDRMSAEQLPPRPRS